MRRYSDLFVSNPSRFFTTQGFLNKSHATKTMVVVNSDFGLKTALEEAKVAGWNTVAIHPEYSKFSAGADLDIPVTNIMDPKVVIKAIQQARHKFSGTEIYVHPVYGWHSEMTELNRAVSKMKRCTMVAPDWKLIHKCGDKREARILVESLGIPIIPGYHGDDTKLSTLIQQWEKLGRRPLMVKAPGGGGGKGNRKATNQAELEQAVNDLGGNVILEAFLTGRYKQIEAQFLITEEGPLYLPFRDCSEMFDHQKRGCELSARYEILKKLFPGMEKIKEYQKILGQYLYNAGYRGPVTGEFMINLDTGEIYFVEMNTRLQVEHGTSGKVAGVSIPTMQRLIAAKLSLDDYLDSQLQAKHIRYPKDLTREAKLNLLEEKSPPVCVQVRIYAQETKAEALGGTRRLVRSPVNCEVTSVNLHRSQHGYVDTYLKPGMNIDTYLVDGMVGIAYATGNNIKSAITAVQPLISNTNLSIPTNQNLTEIWLPQALRMGYPNIHTGSYQAYLNSLIWDSLSDRDSYSEGHYQSHYSRNFC